MLENISQFCAENASQVAFVICIILGIISHYIKKYLKGETTTKLYEWYGRENISATLYSVFFALVVIGGALVTGAVDSDTGFWTSMYAGFVTGFALDSGFNGDSQVILTELPPDPRPLTATIVTPINVEGA